VQWVSATHVSSGDKLGRSFTQVFLRSLSPLLSAIVFLPLVSTINQSLTLSTANSPSTANSIEEAAVPVPEVKDSPTVQKPKEESVVQAAVKPTADVLVGSVWYSSIETTLPDGTLACLNPNATYISHEDIVMYQGIFPILHKIC